MNDSRTRPRRSLVVVLLDAVLRVAAAVQTGATPTPKMREAGARRGAGRYLLLVGVVVALGGTALLVVVLLRTTGGPSSPPDRAAALPELSSRPAAPNVARSVIPGRTDPTVTPSRTAPSTAAGSPGTTAPTRTTPSTESAQPALTASYRTSSITAGLLGYRMTATVANPGRAAKDGWTLTVTLPRSTLRVSGVSGATAAQNGSVWTFTPDATTSRVPAEGSIEVTFEVHGATLLNATPQDCRIDGNRCAS